MITRFRHRKGRCIEFLERDGRWKSTGTHDMQEARTIASAVSVLYIPMDVAGFVRTMLDENDADSWISMTYRLGKMKPGSMKNFLNYVEIYVVPTLGRMQIPDITAPVIQAWYMGLRKKNGDPVSVQTANNALSALSKILRYAEFRGLISSNPCTLAMRMKGEREGFPPFSEEELGRMLPDDRMGLIRIYGSLTDALFFLIARDSGFRPGEVAGLSASCYYPEFHAIYTKDSFDRTTRAVKDSIKTSEKGYNHKVGFLKPFTEKILMEVISDGREYLFIKKNGQMCGQTYYLRRLNTIMKNLGIPKAGRALYSFRSTFFSSVLSDVNDSMAMALMGHTSWHGCYDQRTPDKIVKRARDMYESSHINGSAEGDADNVSRKIRG